VAADSLVMLRHRALTTPIGAPLRNLGALVGGQLLYLTPPVVWAACLLLVNLYRGRSRDTASAVLCSVTLASLPLLGLCLLSRVAEPHWPAPIYLGLALHAARAETVLSRRLARTCAAVAGAATAIAVAWVLWPIAPRLSPRLARHDLANDLIAWPLAMPTVVSALRESTEPSRPPPVVVGPHWTVCAQLHAALPRSFPVGCNSPEGDDFERWLPSAIWQAAPTIIYVTDSRMPDLDSRMPSNLRTDRIWTTDIRRGGVVVRRVRVARLVRSSLAQP
jgi:hypothetical protein